MNRHTGFTLVELTLVMAVVAIIATMAVPAMDGVLNTNRLKGGTSRFYADIQFARSESIKRNAAISVSITSDGANNWCYGLDEAPGCDCSITNPSNANACTLSISGTDVLKVGSVSDFSGIEMTSPVGANLTYASFDPIRGLAPTTGTAVFRLANNREIRVSVSTLGLISVCSPAGAGSVAGYSAC